jgi:hypothetical protein
MGRDVVIDMGTEALKCADSWLREAETCFANSGHGGLVELIRQARLSLEGVPALTACPGGRLVGV